MASNVVPLVAAFGLFLAAPALVAHLAANPVSVALEATDVESNLAQAAANPTGVTSVWVKADGPDVDEANVASVELFRIDVLLGATPAVDVSLHQPGGAPARARLGGYLTVTGTPAAGWDVLVRPTLNGLPESATFRAHFAPAGPVLSATLHAPSAEPVSLDCSFGGAACATSAAGQGASPTLAVEGNLGSKELDSLSLTVNGVDDAYLSVARVEGTGYVVNVGDQQVPVGGTLFTYDGDLASDDVVVFRFMDADGNELAVLTVDRVAGTTRLDPGADAPAQFQSISTVSGVVSVEGDPTAPSHIALLSTKETGTVLTYDAAPSGAGGTLTVAGTETVEVAGLEIEGSPLDPWGFAIVADGTRYDVLTALAAANAALPPELWNPVVTIMKANAPSASYMMGVWDAEDNVATKDDLLADEVAWLGGAPDHTVRVAIPAASDTFTRITVRQSANTAPTVGSPAYALQLVGDEDGSNVYEGYYPPVGRHGEIAHLMLRYETAVTPLVVQTLVETGYAYALDEEAPVATLSVPATPTGSTVAVSWGLEDSTEAAQSGLRGFTVEKKVGNGAFEPWIAMTKDLSWNFQGEAGTTYAFRVKATDNAGNAGEWSDDAKTTFPQSTPPNQAPTVEFVKVPAPASTATGKVTITWKALDDAGTPTVNLYASRDDGATWQSIYSGKASKYDWDVSRLQSGTWKLKIEATDGTKTATAVSEPFQVKGLTAKAADGMTRPGGTGGTGGSGSGSGSGAGGDVPGDATTDDVTGSSDLGTEGGVNGGATAGATSALVWVGGILAFVAVAGLGIAWYMRR